MKKYFYKIGLNLLTLFSILILGSAIIYAQDYQTHYKNGYEYFLQGKYEMAEQDYKKAIELNPNFENAHYWLGKVYTQTGVYDQAIEQWKEVLRINPGNQYAFRNLLDSFKSTSRVQSNGASAYLEEGIKIIGNPEEYLFKGDAPSVSNLLSAIPYFKRAAGIEPNLLDSFYWMGETYRVLGEKSTWQFSNLAIANYKIVLDKEDTTNSVSFNHTSSYRHSYVQLAKIYSSLGLKDKEEKLWLQLEKTKSLPYKQALGRKGYFDFGYPSRIEINFKDGDKIEKWNYPEKDIIFTVVNGEVEGEKEKMPEQSEIEIKVEETVPEENN